MMEALRSKLRSWIIILIQSVIECFYRALRSLLLRETVYLFLIYCRLFRRYYWWVLITHRPLLVWRGWDDSRLSSIFLNRNSLVSSIFHKIMVSLAFIIFILFMSFIFKLSIVCSQWRNEALRDKACVLLLLNLDLSWLRFLIGRLIFKN